MAKIARKKRTISIYGILLMMMCGLTLFSSVLLISAAVISGLRPTLDDIAYRTLYNHAADSVSGLSSELTLVSRTAREYADGIGKDLSDCLEAGELSFDDIQGDIAAVDDLLGTAYSRISLFLESSSASGAFVMLDTFYTDEAHRAALYIRDPSPSAGAGKSSDNTLLRGHTRILREQRLALDKSWEYEQPIDADNDEYFTLPLEAASLYPKADRRDWGYWSDPARLSRGDIEIVTYTTPILTSDGKTMGVFGVEYSTAYLQQIIPSENLPFDQGFFLIAKIENDDILRGTAFSASRLGAMFLSDFDSAIAMNVATDSPNYTIYEIVDGRTKLYAAYAPLGLYGTNSPFIEQDYELFAIAPYQMVLESSNNITMSIMISMAVSVLLSVLGAQVVSKRFSVRIEALASQMRDAQPEEPLTPRPTYIAEIDELANTIQKLSRDIRAYAARMSSIVDMVGIPMGAFEANLDTGELRMTGALTKMLPIPTGEIGAEEFLALLPGVVFPQQDDTHTESEICLSEAEGDRDIWLRVRLLKQDERLYGTLIDITDEMRQKQWLEYERDYDPLTRLLNRNSYPSRMNKVIEENPSAMGIMVFGDLDNLKTTNDTFGHDMGDRYIRLAAKALNRFADYGGIVARISGDEFVAYMHGMKSRKELREVTQSVLKEIRDTEMPLPDGSIQKVRISVGLAYYPDDASSIADLIRFADFAMYEIKHSVKGGTREFDRASYDKNSFILNKRNQLDMLIEDRRLRFAFQPIIDVRTGKPFGFEALMRPQMREFHTPIEVIKLARAQSKLYQIECLTLSCIFEYLRGHEDLLENYHIFINLVANQLLGEEDLLDLAKEAPKNAHRIVMEITESENAGEEIIKQKLASIRARGYGVALDDYGTGYNSEVSLLLTTPDYLKIDMSIVRNINNDPNRQRMMRTIAEYAGENGIKVIAEGVETLEEMSTSIMLGADYIQGYYTGKPELEAGVYQNSSAEQAAEIYHALRK